MSTNKTKPFMVKGLDRLLNADDFFPYGVEPGTTDYDAERIQAAIDELGTRAGSVLLTPGKTYSIGETINLGDGTSTTYSTKNGIVLEGGFGGGFGIVNTFAPFAKLNWVGPAETTMVRIIGPTTGMGVKRIAFSANFLARTCLHNTHGAYGRFEDLYMTAWKSGTAIINDTQSPSFITDGNGWNTWSHIFVIGPGSADTNGMLLDGTPASGCDTTQNLFQNMLIGYGGVPGTYGLKLKFADSNIFLNVGVIAAAMDGGNDISFERVPSLPNFPYQNIFHMWSPTPNLIGGTSGTSGNYFPHFNTIDGPFPNIPYLSGGGTDGKRYINGVGGFTGTKTVRAAGGSSDIDLNFIGGILM